MLSIFELLILLGLLLVSGYVLYGVFDAREFSLLPFLFILVFLVFILFFIFTDDVDFLNSFFSSFIDFFTVERWSV